MIPMSAVARPAERIVARTVGGETVIVSEKGDALHTLNGSGSFIWSRLDGTRSLADILALLSEKYDVPAARAQADLLSFIEELVGKGILRIDH